LPAGALTMSIRSTKKARRLLSSSYMSIKEITHAIGYEHTSSFIRAFERRLAHSDRLKALR